MNRDTAEGNESAHDTKYISGDVIPPISVSQKGNWYGNKAYRAVDNNPDTFAHTDCGYNRDLWYKMQFGAVHYFSEVVMDITGQGGQAKRMDDTKVHVLNTEQGTDFLCGTLKFDKNNQDQIYRYKTDLKSVIRLLLRFFHVK